MRSRSLASIQQRLHAIENCIGNIAFRHQWQRVNFSGFVHERYAIRFNAESRARFSRVIYNNQIETFLAKFACAFGNRVLRFQREAYNYGTLFVARARSI